MNFSVKKRCRHVLTEGARVNKSKELLEAGNIAEFCRLVDESHKSCAEDYEISTPEVDQLVEICRRSGALGARITGAGFGGCVICIVKEDNVEDLIENVTDKYYREYLKTNRPEVFEKLGRLEESIFPCLPAGGADRIVI